MARKKTHQEYIKEVAKINPNIEVLGEYINNCTKILHRCKIDGHEWMTIPNSILMNKGCPVCSKQAIGKSPEYKNSIWASEYREYFSQYMTEEQMKQHMPKSNQHINITCPNCKRVKSIKIEALLRQGLGCICSDGVSYPNKFIYNLLDQLNIKYIIEYSPDWAKPRRYDVYIPLLNCIIENNGIQHYNGSFAKLGGRTHKEENNNDKFKEQLAKTNMIQCYISINCSLSNKEWIKTSILNSELPTLLCFTENDIDWDECNRFATSNLVKITADLWNNGLITHQIAKELKISTTTVVSYLKKSVEIGWTNYSTDKAYKIQGLRRRGGNNNKSKKIIRLSDNKIYQTGREMAKDNNLCLTTVTKYCRLHKGFMFYDEWLTQQNN